MTESPVAPDGGPSLLGGYARGVAWTYLSVLLTGASTFFLAGWSVRRVGTAEFGQFAVVAGVAGLLTMFDYAMGLTVQRATARAESGSPEAPVERATVHAAHGAYAAVGVLVAAVAVAVAAALRVAGPARMPRLWSTVALLGLATALQLATAALPAVALGGRRFLARSAASLAGLAVRVAVAVLAVGRLGVPGLALAHLLGVAVDRAVLLVRIRRQVPWFVARPSVPERAALRGVAGFALPLLVLNASAQLLVVSDLVVIGSLVGAAAVGVYQVGALVPLQLGGLLMIGYNVAFPTLAGSDDRAGQESATAFLTGLFAFVGAAGLALAALLRADVVEVMLGRPSALAGDVVAITCAVCMANLALHGLVSLLIARGEQAVMARLVAVELPLNLVLTVSLVLAMGTVGAAVATLATVAVLNFVAFPIASRGRFARPALATVARHGLLPTLAGAAVALAAALLADVTAGAGVGRLAMGAVSAAVFGGATGLVLLGAGGRRTLRVALAPDRRAGSAPAPVIAG